MKSKLEYIWLDGYKPTQSLRSKTQVRSDFGGTWKNARCGHSMAVLPCRLTEVIQTVC